MVESAKGRAWAATKASAPLVEPSGKALGTRGPSCLREGRWHNSLTLAALPVPAALCGAASRKATSSSTLGGKSAKPGRGPAANSPLARRNGSGTRLSTSLAAPACWPCLCDIPSLRASCGWWRCDKAKGATPGICATSEFVETAKHVWDIVLSSVRSLQIEERFRFQKSELQIASLRLQGWQARRTMLLLVTLASGFLLALLSASLWAARCRLLLQWCPPSHLVLVDGQSTPLSPELATGVGFGKRILHALGAGTPTAGALSPGVLRRAIQRRRGAAVRLTRPALCGVYAPPPGRADLPLPLPLLKWTAVAASATRSHPSGAPALSLQASGARRFRRPGDSVSPCKQAAPAGSAGSGGGGGYLSQVRGRGLLPAVQLQESQCSTVLCAGKSHEIKPGDLRARRSCPAWPRHRRAHE